MKTISLHQPHASLVSTGKKPYETRNRLTHVRGDILIHASLTREAIVTMWANGENSLRHYMEALEPLLEGNSPQSFNKAIVSISASLPFGAIVCVCTLGAPIQVMDNAMPSGLMINGNGFGDFSVGRWAWPLTNVRRFVKPIPWKGRQGWFNVDIDLSQHPTVQVT